MCLFVSLLDFVVVVENMEILLRQQIFQVLCEVARSRIQSIWSTLGFLFYAVCYDSSYVSRNLFFPCYVIKKKAQSEVLIFYSCKDVLVKALKFCFTHFTLNQLHNANFNWRLLLSNFFCEQQFVSPDMVGFLTLNLCIVLHGQITIKLHTLSLQKRLKWRLGMCTSLALKLSKGQEMKDLHMENLR